MPDYVSAADYRAYVPDTGTTGNDADAIIDLYLDEAEEWIDWVCGRHFGVVEDEDRDYWGEGISLLRIDPAYEVGQVNAVGADGATELIHTRSYVAVPPLGVSGAQQHTHLRRLPNGGWSDNCRYRVTGKFGMAATPPGIKLATLELAALRRVESVRAPQAAQLEEDGGDAGGTITPSEQSIVDQYLLRWIIADPDRPRGKVPWTFRRR